jgi:hypothetical protein
MTHSEFAIGQTVKIVELPAYIKTADPMPMLRSNQNIQLGELGLIVDRRPGNYWAVKFDRGTYLIEPKYLELKLIEN